MIIDQTMRHSVAFLVQESNGTLRPMASAFFIGINYENLFLASYLVTARHNIEFARSNAKPLYMRINTMDRIYKDIELDFDRWLCHGLTDVAIHPVELPVGVFATWIPVGMLLTTKQTTNLRPKEGAPVCMPCLFSEFFGSNIMHPLIRTGQLALVPSEKIRAKVGPSQAQDVEGYLIETLSWGGCSGAPVFIDYCDLTATGPDIHSLGETRLLGLISGHYDVVRKVSRPINENIDDELESEAADALNVPLNSGIALVIPAQAILDLVLDEEQIRQQKKRMSGFVCPLPEM